ncbi:hypothetical protein NPIL_556281 [Nephila pilipes]|uniref:Uncharacterized protein n=1 Tax=Nephila pilipes TaxID=299642 RepID=A0A8X6N036_NEPPI|nr:hypothetical protein NPIL_556281 [Nephila pilipes]
MQRSVEFELKGFVFLAPHEILSTGIIKEDLELPLEDLFLRFPPNSNHFTASRGALFTRCAARVLRRGCFYAALARAMAGACEAVNHGVMRQKGRRTFLPFCQHAAARRLAVRQSSATFQQSGKLFDLNLKCYILN